MEKAGAGGRPKAVDMWEHVTVLEGKKVKCKHCGFEFAASANRIKAHINQIKGQGIRLCPGSPQLNDSNSNKVTSDLNEKEDFLVIDESFSLEDLLHPQVRDETSMLDCYMSPKTMWEGIKALQQVQMHTRAMHQQRIHVGPFSVSHMVKEPDLRLIQYVFEQSCSDETIIFSSPRLHLKKSEFTTLGPEAWLDSLVIDIFVDILTETERKKSKPLNRYLPVMFSTKALESNVISSLKFVEEQKMIENYMFDLKYCEKIFLPVYVEQNRCGHFYLYIIHVEDQEVEIWDSLSDQFMDKTEREQITKKILLVMETLFEDVMSTKFHWRMASNIPSQSNGYDCGVFVIKYMQQLDNYVRQNPSFQFDSNKERLDLALELLNCDFNQEKQKLYDKATGSYAQVKSEEDIVSCGIKRKQVDTCKTIFDGGKGACMELDDFNDRIKRKNVSSKTGCVKGNVFPTTELVGKEFQGYIERIWEWVMGDEVSTIGIWGMAGAGKTFLATHVHNKLLEEAGDDFDHVIWVTAPQYCSIYELQKDIARSINLDISDEHDVKRISGKLLQASKHINRCVLILDNVWDPIFLEEVGFPISNNRIKLILTTRSREVCQSMNCVENIIEVEPLDESEGEDWELFENTLGFHQIESSEVMSIASTLVEQCGGLPLAIVTIAKSMKGKKQYREWNHMLECIQNLGNGQDDMDKWIFPVLKSSYACLNNKLQRFFLYAALSAEYYYDDEDISRLIRRFFIEGSTDETKSLEMQYNEGYTLLDKLKNNSLVIKIEDQWRIHPLLRGMAINIAKATEEIMAKSDMNLIEIPENGEWHENLQKVFLSGNRIQKIVDGTSLKCSKLSTLLLDNNHCLKLIPDDFFNNMPALKVLDLSRTGIQRLPKSVSNLECLITLLLSKCWELSDVPSLEKLQRLMWLDLSNTVITEAPRGLDSLVNLRYLNLKSTRHLTMSSSVIAKMTNLQSLTLNCITKSMDGSAQVLQRLGKLEYITANFCDIEEFNSHVQSLQVKDRALKGYYLSLTTSYDDCFLFRSEHEVHSLKRVVFAGIDLENRPKLYLPEDIKELMITHERHHWTGTTCLCQTFSFPKRARIEYLTMRECDTPENLFCGSPACPFWDSVRFVKTLDLTHLKDLKQLVALSSPFYHLRQLLIHRCSSMRILMMWRSFEQLQYLEAIDVQCCHSMEEIVGDDCSGDTVPPTTIALPKLRYVTLWELPELKSVFRGAMLCPSLKYFSAFYCEKLISPPLIETTKGNALQMEKRYHGYETNGVSGQKVSTGYHCDK